MEAERYAGERRALRHFLSGLRPLVLDALGHDSLLYHRIDRALRGTDLKSLRDARRAFHNQPAALKRRLLEGLLDRPGDGARGAAGARGGGERRTTAVPGTAFVRFQAPGEPRRVGDGLSVSLSRRPPAAADGGSLPVQVFIRPGTLPRAAAGALRAVADRIEQERRLLSPRYWERAAGGEAGDDGAETADQA